MYLVSGTVKEQGVPVQRTVRAYSRSNGYLIGETVSAEDGTFSIRYIPDEYLVDVLVLDDDADPNYNDMVFKTLPVVDPDIIEWGNVADISIISSISVINTTFTRGLLFKQDGMKFYYLDYGKDLRCYEMTSPYDISTATYSSLINLATIDGKNMDPSNLVYTNGGNAILVCGYNLDYVFNIPLLIQYDVMSLDLTSATSYYVGGKAGVPRGVAISEDGTIMLVMDNTSRTVYTYTLSTPFDITTASYTGPDLLFNPPTYRSSVFAVRSDGTRIITSDNDGNDLFQYTLSTPWDLSSASYMEDTIVVSEESNVTGCYVRPDGSELFLIGHSGDKVYRYSF